MDPASVLLALVSQLISAGMQKIEERKAANKPLSPDDWREIMETTTAAVDANRACDPK